MAKSPAFRFYPSDFLGSPDVQIMDATEVGAYWLLLCTAWLSEQHGHLPDDHDRLRRWARLSHEQWERSKSILLSKFPLADDGTRYNPRMVEEAEKQRLYSEAQSRKGKSGGRPQKKLELFPEKPELSKRKPNTAVKKAGVKPSVSVSVSASVSGEEQEQKPSRDKREVHPLFSEVKALIFRYYRSKNGLDPEWDGMEARNLSALLAANPTAPIEHWTQCLINRFQSDVAHGDRPGLWLSRLSSFRSTLNEYNRPKDLKPEAPKRVYMTQ